ncbi:MAG: hypothetical protein AAFX03_02405 [Pseudomonadota bacterium]
MALRNRRRTARAYKKRSEATPELQRPPRPEDPDRIYRRELGEALRRARLGGAGLALFAIVGTLSAIVLFATLPEYAWERAAQGDELAAEHVGMLVGTILFLALALITMVFAFWKLSRIAMIIGLTPFILNWLGYIYSIAVGQLMLEGILWSIICPVMIVQGIYGAHQYHKLQARRQPDVEAFA